MRRFVCSNYGVVFIDDLRPITDRLQKKEEAVTAFEISDLASPSKPPVKICFSGIKKSSNFFFE